MNRPASSDAQHRTWRPPAPRPASGLRVAWWLLTRQRRDLLEVLTADAYSKPMIQVPVGRRTVFMISDPDLIRQVFVDQRHLYPKSDLMVSALSPLVGDGVLVSEGDTWEHDRQMLSPAFAQMRLEQVFPLMQATVVEHVKRIEAMGDGVILDLEETLSHLTADIVFRAIFSEPIDGADAAEVFVAFMRFQRNAPQFDLSVVLRSDPAKPEALSPDLLADSRAVRALIGKLLDRRYLSLQSGTRFDDFAQAAIDARDSEGRGFDRERLIDQLTVLFLAGHETSASALTWALFMLSQQPAVVRRLRDEASARLGGRTMMFADARELPLSRSVFRETLRLYPPPAFLTRMAAQDTWIRDQSVSAGSLVIVSTWVVHRHQSLWQDPDRFDPDRFLEGAPPLRPGSWIPFGLGARACTGAAFAQLEAQLILTEILRRFDFNPVYPERVMPVSRVTVRPRGGLLCQVRHRDPAAA